MKRRKDTALSDAEKFYYIGIRDALEWVQESRKEQIHVDTTPAEPVDERIDFE